MRRWCSPSAARSRSSPPTALVEGVHFDRRFSSPGDIGWKALAVNLVATSRRWAARRGSRCCRSALPATAERRRDRTRCVDGFLALAAEARVTLAGGNITRSPGPLMVDVTVTGIRAPRHVLTRGGGARRRRALRHRQRSARRRAGSAGCRRRTAATGAERRRDGVRASRASSRARAARADRRAARPEPRRERVHGPERRPRRRRAPDRGGARAPARTIDAAALPIPAGAREWFARDAASIRSPPRPSRAATTTSCCSPCRARVARPPRHRSSARRAACPITRIGQLTAGARRSSCVRDGVAEPLPPRVRPLLSRCRTSPRTRRWLDQLLHTHDTPQRTARRLRARRLLRVLAAARPAHRARPGLRVRAST